VADLKGDLATLKIERVRPGRSPWRWPLLFFIPVILVLGGLYALRVQQALAAPEVETVVASVSRGGEDTAAGAPILLPSFRVSNAKLKALGWAPAYPSFRSGLAA